MAHGYTRIRTTRIARGITALWVAGIVIVAAGILFQRNMAAPAEYKKVTIHTTYGTIGLTLEVANTPQKRTQGLMFRRNLEKNTGMIFVFDADTTSSFWMKNTPLPLDILFLDARKTIVDYVSMDPCIKDPCQLYGSQIPYGYAIEVGEGFIRKKQVKIGDTVDFP